MKLSCETLILDMQPVGLEEDEFDSKEATTNSFSADSSL